MANWLKTIFKKYKDLFLILLLLLIIFFSYSKVIFLFFQQDELFMFGDFIRLGWKAVFVAGSFRNLAHFIPISLGLSYGIFSLFGLNHVVFNIAGLLIHLLNGFLVYKLAKNIFKKKELAILSSIIFFSCNQASELVMWPVASINSLSLTFILLGWLYFIKKVEFNQEFKLVDGVFVSILFLLAVFVIEYSAMFAIFFPLLVVIFSEKFSKKSLIKLLLPFLLVSVSYFILRFFSTGALGTAVPATTRLVTLLSLPFVYVSQLFLGQGLLLFISKWFSADSLVVESVIYRYIAELIGVVIYIVSLFIAKKVRKNDKRLGNYLFTFLTFIFISSLPFVMVLGGNGSSWVVPSRYLYFATVAYSLIIIFLVSKMLEKRKLRSFTFIILAILIGCGTYLNFVKSENLYLQGKIRLGILNKIREIYPKLPQKTVFYFLSDSSFYGLPETERILPFQSGLGQTLLVWYAKSEKFPDAFLSNRFLWDITSQDYMESGDRGFGFFRDFDKMVNVLKINKLLSSEVIAFKYNSKLESLEDITNEVRGSITGFFSNRKEINGSLFSLHSSLNDDEVYLAKDGNRGTYWNSKLPYKPGQYIEVSLSRETKIAQIQIDSYNDENQNNVGYKVSLLGGDRVWHEVFSADKYPPNKDGIVNLYFAPQITKQIKIEQIGKHDYASWVVNEIKLYEAIN